MPQRPCLVLTRPKPESERFAAQARDAGWRGEIIIAPLQQIVLLALNDSDFAAVRTLVVTSQHAVRALVLATERRDWLIWAVGARTAEVAREAGFENVLQSGGDAAALLADLTRNPPPAPVLHLRGRHAAADIATALRARGQDATSLVGYEQVACPLDKEAQSRLQQGGDVVLPVFSPRSASLLSDAIGMMETNSSRVHLIAISTAALKAAGMTSLASIRIAAHPDAGSMCDALVLLQQTLEQ